MNFTAQTNGSGRDIYDAEMPNIIASPAVLDDTSSLFAALTHWVGAEVSTSQFGPLKPTETNIINSYFQTARIVGLGSKKGGEIDEDDWNSMKMLLWRLWHITDYDRDLSSELNVKGILTMFATPANNFRSPIPEVAAKLTERFDLQNWGNPQLTHEAWKSNAAIFGHNGFFVGQCWARQVAAVRDGVHGSLQAGIYGTAAKGAYSIVISGAYGSLDEDTGLRVFYSGAGALDTVDTKVDKNKYTTRSLIKSIETGAGIRVLRSSEGAWKGRPKAGKRYDGLYKAVGYKQRTNQKGGEYLQFELVRMGGQPDIDENAPGPAETRAFERVADGY